MQLSGTRTGTNAKDEIITWLEERAPYNLVSGDCLGLHYQRAAQDLEKSGDTLMAELLVRMRRQHLLQCSKDPIMMECIGPALIQELMRLAAFEVLLENLHRHRN